MLDLLARDMLLLLVVVDKPSARWRVGGEADLYFSTRPKTRPRARWHFAAPNFFRISFLLVGFFSLMFGCEKNSNNLTFVVCVVRRRSVRPSVCLHLCKCLFFLCCCFSVYSSVSFLATMSPLRWLASIWPPSIMNSVNASLTSCSLNLSPQVIRECLNLEYIEDGFVRAALIQLLFDLGHRLAIN